MQGGMDTMPIRIPVGLKSTLDDDTAQSIAAFGRLRAAMRATKADAALTGKSFAELQRNEEQLTARKAQLEKRLVELTNAYRELDPAVEGNGDRLAKLTASIAKTEKEIARMGAALEQVKLAEYAQGADELAAQIEELEQATEREVAVLRMQGRESEAAQLAERNAVRIKELYAERVKALGAAVEKAAASEGANSKIVQELAIKYNQAADALKGLGQAATETQGKVEKMGDSTQQSIDDTLKSIGGLMSAKSGLTQFGDAMQNKVTQPILNAGKAAMDAAIANESMEQTFNSVFKSNADEVRRWSQAISDNMSVSEYRVREYSSNLKILFNGLGMEGGNTTDMIKQLTRRAYDLAALMDSDVATAFEKLRAGLTGSSEPLMQWGIVVKDNQVKAYAWREGIAKAGKELTEQQKVLARYGLIMEQSQQAQGRWNEEADSTSGKLKTNAERLDEINVKLGEQLVPVMDSALNIIEPLAKWLGNLNERGAKAVVWIAGAVAALGPLIRLLGVIQQFQMASKLGGVLQAGTALSNFLGGPFMTTLGKVVMVAIALAAAIALVAGMIALANGNAAKYQQALNDSNKISERVKNAQSSAKALTRGNARGTRYFEGGGTWVGEEGPEYVELPQGSRIRPAGESRRLANRGGDTYMFNVEFERVKDVVGLVSAAKNARRLARQY